MDILELQDKLDALSSWRKSELFQAHSLAENAPNEEARRYLCRAWVLIMYAHCDNFLKEATKLYIGYIKVNSHVKYRPELMWLIMKGEQNITEASEEKYQPLINYHTINKELLFEVIVSKDVLAKRSFKYKSLRFFCDWVLQISYDHQTMNGFCEQLKEKRDAIAHGEESYVHAIDDCLPWHTKTISFIDSLKDSIIQAAQTTI